MPQLDLPKSYEAAAVEGDVYQRWESTGCFKAGAGARPGKPAYSIAIPPPNVTGVLHIGHALNNTLQDTLIRWRRMQGHDVLWQPGTDHAGIATESVVAKLIQSDQDFLKDLSAAVIAGEQPPDADATRTPTGYDRDRFGRAPFLKAVWFFKARSGGTIVKQLRLLGASCDWSRERFTLDDGLSHAVRVQFVRLYQQGLIYRGTRMVNWCPVQRTALSDDEVDHIEKNGHLWKLRYDLEDHSGSIVVETTRPETFFGDTAVAVNPSDERYRALIGKRVRLPIIGRLIPIVGDEHADPTKGSGAVKITPAHDPNDYLVGQRHQLPLVRCIGFDGLMTAEAGPYAGLDRFVCRKQLIKDFEASGVLLGATEIVHSVGHGERSGAPIEPMVTEQWFVKMGPLAERAIPETTSGRVAFHPERWTKVYLDWLANVRDWCISRQIWWGHRIPAWHCATCRQITVAVAEPGRCAHCGSSHVSQDPDVLDTWFSSALWPFSTLGWPDLDDPALARYFPTSTLVTDRGIIYFWVARMVMASLFALDRKPFSDVYIHGTVLDERGEKMSKSKGNGIDPVVMIQGGTQRYLGKDYTCPGYGADALRFTLLDMTTEGQDLKLSPTRFESGRNFANKVWNAGRFVLINLSQRPLAQAVTAEQLATLPLGFPEQWILGRLQTAIADCTSALEKFRYSEYANGAYRFFRDDLCDWYVEWAKRRFKADGEHAAMAAQVLSYCFDAVLRLLHPGMPFITEFLWQQLQATVGGAAWQEQRFLMLSAWPEPQKILYFSGTAERMAERQALVTAVRHIRNLAQLADATPLAAVFAAPDPASAAALEIDREFLVDRAALSDALIAEAAKKPAGSVTAVVGAWKVHVPLTGLVDLAKFREQLAKREAQLAKSIAGKESRLGNADYIARAPGAQVEETRAMLAAEQVELANLRETLAGL
ncbi:valine--tRNA ligase [Planctomycetota bacterium]|nr:valine--tRNA ligase [Planctomycetota bacterium]